MFKHQKNLKAQIKLHSIEQVGAKFKIPTREIVFYQKRGLLSKLAEGVSSFITDHDVARLKVILAGKRAGLKLAVIAKMLNGKSNTRLEELENLLALKNCRTQINELEKKKLELTEVILDLERSCVSLNEWQCATPSPSNPPAELKEKFGL